jgi:hypothetical protein
MILGAAIGLVVGGIAFVLLSTVADTEFGRGLTAEDGPIEWLGALAFLVAAILQSVLFLRSRVPERRRLLPFMARNPFFLGLAVVLFLGFAEEISWGQRIFGWATPAGMVVENIQGETNIHNLALFYGDSLLSIHRLFNIFWFSYCVLVPITAAFVALLSRLYDRISLPIPPLWIGGLFVGAFLSWRVYYLFEPPDAIAAPQELSEALTSLCFVALGLAQLGALRLFSDARPRTADARPLEGSQDLSGTPLLPPTR